MAELPDVIVGCTPVHIGVPPGEFPLTLRLQDCDAILAALEGALNKGIDFGPGIPRRIVEEAGRRIEAAALRERESATESAQPEQGTAAPCRVCGSRDMSRPCRETADGFHVHGESAQPEEEPKP